jgi:hypothetical protein
VRGLSGDIALKPGELRIEFYGAKDLAAKLFELSQAMADDSTAFARASNTAPKGRTGSKSREIFAKQTPCPLP